MTVAIQPKIGLGQKNKTKQKNIKKPKKNKVSLEKFVTNVKQMLILLLSSIPKGSFPH